MKKFIDSITRTLSNPDEIDSVISLKQELRSANARVVDLSMRLHSIVNVAHNQQLGFGQIIDAHDRNDYEMVRSILESMSARRIVFAASLKKDKPH